MTRITKRFVCLCLVALVGVPAGALAQDVAQPAPVQAQPAPVAAEPAPAPAPAPEPVLAPAPAPEAPAATEETEPAPAEDAGAPVTGWFRIDSDIGSVQLWGGSTFPLSDTIGLATDIYVYTATAPNGGLSYGEFDIGPSITVAPGISLLPMVGLQINWSMQKAAAFVPQFYAYVDTSVVYFEFWSQLFLQDMFTEGLQDYLHLRAFPLFKASDSIAIGLEIDANIVLKNAILNADGDEVALAWLPIGPHVKMAAGASSTIELFVGYDLADEAVNGDRRLAGRFTFTQTF